MVLKKTPLITVTVIVKDCTCQKGLRSCYKCLYYRLCFVMVVVALILVSKQWPTTLRPVGARPDDTRGGGENNGHDDEGGDHGDGDDLGQCERTSWKYETHEHMQAVQ